jgi:hypothetical protein
MTMKLKLMDGKKRDPEIKEKEVKIILIMVK